MSRFGVSIGLAIAAMLSVSDVRVKAQQAEPESNGPERAGLLHIGALQLGFNGVYKVGRWTPLAVTLQSTSDAAIAGDLEVEVVDGDGVSTIVRERGITVSAGGSTVVHTLIKPGRPKGAVNVRFESPDTAAEKTFDQDDIPHSLLATQELFVEVGRPIGLDRLQRLYPDRSLERSATVTVADARTLPLRSLGYEGVDVVVLTTSDAAFLEAWSDDDGRIGALDEWVKHGGKLMFCVGREGRRVLARESPLARFAPGAFERVVEPGPSPWESLVGASADPMHGSIAGPVLRDVRGRIELTDRGGVPLVIRSSYGLGEVLFVAADLDLPPFADWSSRTKLLLRLLGRSELSPAETVAGDTTVQSVRLGYTDLAGQLRSALGQFAGARVVPFWLVFFLALGYAALVFPVEYWLARSLRPRFEAAWLLLPAVLAAGVLGIGYLVVAWKGDEVLLKKAEVVDVDVASGVMRGQTWLSLYNPNTDAYDIGVFAQDDRLRPLVSPQLSWLGLPGTGLGGMNSQIAAPEQFERGYHFADDGSLRAMPLTAWSSKVLDAVWHNSAAASTAQLGERSENRQPLGSVKNGTTLKLSESVLFYAGWTYPLGTLEPAASVDVGRIQPLRTVNSYLTGRRQVGDKELATPYAADDTELPQIMRAILFYDSASGRQYTSLSNRVFHDLDLTGQLRLDRAVLLAVGPPATKASVTSARATEPRVEEELAWYRFVIPVDRSRSSDEADHTVELRLK